MIAESTFSPVLASAVNTCTTDTMPLTKSQTANRIAIVMSVAPGHTIAMIPMMMLRMPSARTRPQWDPTCCISSWAESTVLAAPVMPERLPSAVPAG